MHFYLIQQMTRLADCITLEYSVEQLIN
uniref:Uncharacterized protein n=1 Tax=Anguilla anguilla TaxID=7936 RepID=A0A0E9W588_ANGAN